MGRAPLRVGLLGYGIAGRVFHAPLVAATPGLRLDAVVTRDPERRAQFALRLVVPSACQVQLCPGQVVLHTAPPGCPRVHDVRLRQARRGLSPWAGRVRHLP